MMKANSHSFLESLQAASVLVLAAIPAAAFFFVLSMATASQRQNVKATATPQNRCVAFHADKESTTLRCVATVDANETRNVTVAVGSRDRHGNATSFLVGISEESGPKSGLFLEVSTL